MTPTKPINQEAKTKTIKARIGMLVKQPFFGELAMNLKMVEDDTLKPPTAATDGVHLFYHPNWVLNADQDVVESMIAHEVGHVVFDHIGRRNGRTPKRWNFANDYQLNLVLKDCGFMVPNDWLCSAAFTGMSSDEIYNVLPPDPPSNGQGQFDKHYDALPPGTDSAQHKQDIEIAIIQAGNAQKEYGNTPGSLKRFIEEITMPKADWQSVMSRFATEQTREDYSYARVNKKFAALGIYLPGLYSEGMGEIGACIDTSGSITKDVLDAFGAHLSEIKAQMKPSATHILYCDSRMNHADKFEEYDDLVFDMHGGGGTDFRPPFKHLEKEGIEPKCFMYLTDGYGPFPAHPPDYPVLWLMTTDVQPPWGEVVKIEV
jgi:predicted metal-dependent peptidase